MYKRFNSDGTVDTTFNVVTGSTGSGGEVIVPDYYSKVLIGGLENSINGKSPSGNFARLNQDGTTAVCGEVITYTLYLEMVYNNEPCTPMSMVYNIYLGSDGKYYLDQGGTYVLVSSITTTNTWYYNTGMFNNGIRDIYTYEVYTAVDGGFELIDTINSNCPPFQF